MDVSTLTINNDNGKKIINDTFRIVTKIGQGQYGKVFLTEDVKHNNKHVAIKTINRIDRTKLITKTYLSHATKIKREIQIMKESNHPNVVKLYQVIDDLKYDKILLVLEYCKFGEINWRNYNHYYERYQNDNRLTLNRILRDVINGLEYLHQYKGIIHRDLKPSNLLIDENYGIKISDFGVSLILENNANDDIELGKTMGTPAFFAPELCQFVNNRYSMIKDLDKKVKIDSRIDIWSLGVTLYALAFNAMPFDGCNEFDLFKKIVNDKVTFPNIKKSSRALESDLREFKYLKDLILHALEKDSSKRITIDQIKEHEFTLFDLNEKEKKAFQNFNKNLIEKQHNEDFSLAGRIKHFFTGKNSESHELSKKVQKSTEVTRSERTDPRKLIDLEPVDDILDSYFDESSFIESDDDAEEYNPSALNNDVAWSSTRDSKQSEVAKNRPSPLLLQTNLFEKRPSLHSRQSDATSQNSSVRDSPHTPLSSHTAIIGASTPKSSTSFFSPSKKFFSRKKKSDKSPVQKHTIGSLYSLDDNPATFMEPPPPPIFSEAANMGPPAGQIASHSDTRKNSVTSSFNSLSRITSSSSSLNLNAYLTEESPKAESFSSKNLLSRTQTGKFHLQDLGSASSEICSVNDETNDPREGDRDESFDDTARVGDNEYADETFIVGDDRRLSKFKGMHEYLDELV